MFLYACTNAGLLESFAARYSLPVYLTCQEQREKKNVFVTAFFFPYSEAKE